MNMRQAALEHICRQFDVGLLYSFGSRAVEVRDWVEEYRDQLPAGLSDADIGVKALTGKKWSVREKVQLAGALEELLGISRVDLVCLTEANPFVAAEIIRGKGYSPATATRGINTNFMSFAGPGTWPRWKENEWR
jgi:hypothetical protein